LASTSSEEFSSDDESSIFRDGLDVLDAPPLIDGDLPNNDYDVGEEECMFEQAKMYTNRGNGCFANEEIHSICLLGIMRDIEAPLKMYGRIVALFKDVITEATRTGYHHLPSIFHERTVSHCFDPAKSMFTMPRP
jgi:hypothetical protein